MDRNFALFQLAMARPNNRALTGRSVGATLAVLIVGAIVIAAVAIPLISG
jgi:hypothetical protein